MRKPVARSSARLSFGGGDVKSASMKLIIPPIACMAVALLGFNSSAVAEASPFRLRVEQVTKAEVNKFTKKQERSLKIFVSNSAKEPAELRAKYVFFGRDAKGKEVVKIDEGEKAVSVGPLSTAMVESGMATATSELPHSSGSNAGKGKSTAGSKGAASKTVAGSGDKIIGFGVQVYQGEAMVAEYYDPPSGKEEWSKAYPVKLPTAPKK